MNGYSKLDCGIVDSSLWEMPHEYLRVWIAMLAKTDATGYVRVASPAMARLCHLTREDFDRIIDVYCSPDPESRTSDNDGRRLERVEGGWQILNYTKYREGLKQPDSSAARMRKLREKRKCDGFAVTVTVGDAYAEAEAEAEAKKENLSDSCPKPDSPATGQQPSAEKRKDPKVENPNDPIVMMFPVKDVSNRQWGLHKSKAMEWKATFGSSVDVASELKKARQWLLDNPDRQKTPRGMVKFLGSWLQKGNNTGRSVQRSANAYQNDDLPEYFREALKAAGKL